MTTSKRIDLLAQRVRDGDESAVDALYEQGYRFVRWVMAKYGYYLNGYGDWADLLQEGMIGFWEAMQSWNGRGVFRPWAEFCVNRELITALIKANRKKHSLLNSAIHLDAPAPGARDEGTSLWDIIGHLMTTNEPADLAGVLEEQERHGDLRRRVEEIFARMSPLERYAYLGVMRDGYTYQQLADGAGKTPKSIDNALQRARNLLRKYVQGGETAMAPRRLNGDEEAVLDALCERPTNTTRGIAIRLGIPSMLVSECVTYLRRRGYVEQAGKDDKNRALWAITDAGRVVATMPNPDVWQGEAWTG